MGERRSPQPTLRLVLVRHGLSVGNQQLALAGWRDDALAEEGREVLKKYRALGLYPETESYYSSDLARCRETFSILYEGIAPAVVFLPAMREINFGSVEGQVAGKVELEHFFLKWLSGEQIYDVENYHAFSDRVWLGFLDLWSRCQKTGSSSATLVAHGGVIRALLIRLQALSPMQWIEIDVPNGLGYDLELTAANPHPRITTVRPLWVEKGAQ